MTVDIEQAIGFAVQIGVLIGLIAGGVVWIKRWIKSNVADPITKQISPNGGGSRDTSRHLIETIRSGQMEIIGRLDRHDQIGEENKRLAEQGLKLAGEALAVARDTSARLDRHLSEGHGGNHG